MSKSKSKICHIPTANKAAIIYEHIFAPFPKSAQECGQVGGGRGPHRFAGDVLYSSDLLPYLCPDKMRFVSQTDVK